MSVDILQLELQAVEIEIKVTHTPGRTAFRQGDSAKSFYPPT